MRLLIAGWHGQVARALVEAAPACPDIEALAVGRPALDLCEPKITARKLAEVRPNIIINTAAYTAVDQAEREPEAAFALNRDGARLLAEAAARLGVPIIHLSTDYVFDGAKPEPYVEDDPTAPASVYGRSKLAGEQAVQAVNPQHIILRTSWVHSPVANNFVKSMLRLARQHSEIAVVDDQIGNPTYAPHLARAILELARQVSKGGASWGTYHATGAGSVTWCGLAREVFGRSAAAGAPSAEVVPITSAQYAAAAPRPANSRLDCGKLASAFGIALPHWRDGVADCVDRLLARPAAGSN